MALLSLYTHVSVLGELQCLIAMVGLCLERWVTFMATIHILKSRLIGIVVSSAISLMESVFVSSHTTAMSLRQILIFNTLIQAR